MSSRRMPSDSSAVLPQMATAVGGGAVGAAAAATAAAAPHMMQLPPSPEFGSLQATAAAHLSSLSIGVNASATATAITQSPHIHHEPPRFRSISNYALFQPDAIACQRGIAAIAGPQGIALFHLSKPQKPCLILNHTFGGGLSGSANQNVLHHRPKITNLQFQPQTFNLAASYGSGVLVWDASGQSLSPLLGRLGGYSPESTSSSLVSGGGGLRSSSESRWFTSMSWNSTTATEGPSSSSSSSLSSTIATTTATTACLWDISSSFTRPALRFGTKNHHVATSTTTAPSSSSSSSYVAVACRDEQAATLDSSGILRVYDIRMADRGTGTAAGAVSTFSAHPQGGVGLVALSSSSSSSSSSTTHNTSNDIEIDHPTKRMSASSSIPQSWMTWGFDTEEEAATVSACVKVWSPCRNTMILEQQQQKQHHEYSANNSHTTKNGHSPAPPSPEQSDSYWFMDGGSTEGSSSTTNRREDTSTTTSNITPGGYKLVARRRHEDSSHNVACARVCPSPLQNGIVTVGVSQEGTWKANLYELDIQEKDNDEDTNRDKHNSDEPTTTTNTTTSFDDGYILDATEESDNFGLKTLATFELGNDPLLRQALSGTRRSSNSHLSEKDNALGPLVGAELAMMTASMTVTTTDPGEKKDSEEGLFQDQELVVCCLSNDGHVTAYAIPEASCLKPSFGNDHSMNKNNRMERTSSPVRRKPVLQMIRGSSDTLAGKPGVGGGSNDKSSKVSGEQPSPSKQNRGVVKDVESTRDQANHDAALAYRQWNNETLPAMGGGTYDRIGQSSLPLQEQQQQQQQQQHYNNQNVLLSPPPDPQQPLQSFDKEDDSVASISRGVEGGMMQFDMDVLGGAYRPVGPGHPHGPTSAVGEQYHPDVAPTITSTTSQSLAQDGVSIEVVGIGGHSNLDHHHHHVRGIGMHRAVVDPKKVPVPRLCGAVFASGKGGLVCFHNGGVKKMWSWYQESNNAKQRRLPGSMTTGVGSASAIPITGGNRSLLASHSSSTTAFTASRQRGRKTNIGTQHNDIDDIDGASTITRDSPRTLQDLRNMMIAAKEAQWGQDNDGAGSSANLNSDIDADDSSAEDLYDDDSLGASNSSDSGSEDDDQSIIIAEATNKKSPKTGDDLYDSYFGQLQKPLATPSSPHSDVSKDAAGADFATKGIGAASPRGAANTKLNVSKGFGAGPSADVLAPVVRVTHSYDGIVMNGQCPELAEKMKLGSWMLSPIYESLDTTHHSLANVASRQESTISDTSNSPPLGLHNKKEIEDGGFIGYFQNKSKTPSGYAGGNQLEQVYSDPMLSRKVANNSDTRESFEDATVRGGEMAVRPNRQESMVFLKKLFNQQGASVVSGMASPPDAPMLPKTFSSSPIRRVTSSHAILQTYAAMSSEVDSGPSAVKPEKLGIFTKDIRERRNKRDGTHRQLSQAKLNCLHNANVCREVGQNDKADVWSLLAQMVDNVLTDSVDDFSGWNEAGALGQGLLDSILRHYEKQGDVQMLASISCVLCCKPEIESKAKGTLLPGTNEERYDSYIRQYANLLYGWGLLTIRTELKKHLVRRLPGNEGALVVPVDHDIDNEASLPGVDFAIMCPTCHIEADKKTNVCPSCHEFAFRCSVCTNAVRGLFTICIICGHGGHVDHVMPWFENHSQCPTGCGCVCLMSTLPSSQPLIAQSDSVDNDDNRME